MFEQLNHSIFFAINNGLHSPVGDVLIGYATYIGNGFIAFPVLLIAMILIDRKHLKRNFLFVLSAAIVEAAILQSLKSLIDAPRPLSVFEHEIAQSKVVVYVMFDKLYGRGFPSGHTQTIWCCATAIIWIAGHSRISESNQRVIAIVSIVIAILVSISRIYVGAHFPFDVIGGMLVGVVPVLLIGKYLDHREKSRVEVLL